MTQNFTTPERGVPDASNSTRLCPGDSSDDDAYFSRRSVRDSAERVRKKKMKKLKKKHKKKKVQISTPPPGKSYSAPPASGLNLRSKKSKRTLWVEKNLEEHEFLRRASQTPLQGDSLQPTKFKAPRGSGFWNVKGGKQETPKPVRFMDAVTDRDSRLNYRTTRSSRNRRRGLKNARRSNEMYESQKIHSRRSVSRGSSNIRSDTRDAIQSSLRKGEPLTDVRPISIDDIEHRESINYWREFRKIRFYRSPTVTRVIGQILQTVIPEIGVTYQTIIDEFLGQSWPISIFLHGGLLRDIMTSVVGNDVDITFSCSHYEMKTICDDRGWKSEIREDIPYWVVGGASHFETKLEGFPLSFNGLAPFHVQDFASNTIYYDCKNNIIIDRYGKGVDAALRNQITLPVYSKEDWEQWKNCDFVPGVKMYRFYKFVVRGFGYDIEEAKFVQASIAGYVAEDQEAAVKSCYHALRDLARGQDSYADAVKYKEKLKLKVVEIYVRTYNAEESKGIEFWETYWEKTVDAAIAMGNFRDLQLFEADPNESALVNNTIEESDGAFESGTTTKVDTASVASAENSKTSTAALEVEFDAADQVDLELIHGTIQIQKELLFKQNSLPSSPGSANTLTSASTAEADKERSFSDNDKLVAEWSVMNYQEE